MNCPNCGLQITDPRQPSCPRCGQPLQAAMPEQQAQGGMPTYPGYGAQPATPPTPYGAQPPYGQPAAPSMPYGYGQPPAPGMPYGQPAAPSTPYYAQGMPGAYPPPPPPQRKRNLGLIIGLPIAIVIVLCVGAFAALAYVGSRMSTATNTNPSATATPNSVIFQDALTSSSHDDNWPNDGNCLFASDGYHIKGGYLCYAPSNDVSNGTVSVQAAQTKGDTTQGYGVVLRRTSKGNYYIFALDSEGEWAFYKFVNDSGTAIKDFAKSSAIHSGLNAKNTLQVTMSGSSFTFYVNGTHVGDATDSTFTSGKTGVAGADSCEIVYTDYKITK